MIHLAPYDYLVRQGDPFSSAFLVESGCLEVIHEGAEGEQLLAVLGPGEIVGEMALVDAAPRSASVRAREASVLLPITTGQIQSRLAGADPVLRLLLDTVLVRFRSTLHQLGGRVLMPCEMPDNGAVKAAALAQLATARELALAIENGEIVVHYQPIVDLADGHVVALEALTRWQHAVRGLIPPVNFVPLAEANDLSAALAVACVRIVARDYPRLQAACAAPGRALSICINISGQDLCSENFIEEMGLVAGPIADRIALELTETALIHNAGTAANRLGVARDMGFSVSVDDFGAGYSSFGYVQKLPLDTLKIDKTYVRGMCESFTSRSIIASMVQLAEALGLATVGEGIETEADLVALRASGCTHGQGYLFSRPVALLDVLALLEDWTPNRYASWSSQAQAGGGINTDLSVIAA